MQFSHIAFPVCQITRPRPPPRCLLPPVDPLLLSSPECKEAGRRRVGPGVIMHTFRAAEGGCRPFHYKGCGATDNLVRGNHLCIFFPFKKQHLCFILCSLSLCTNVSWNASPTKRKMTSLENSRSIQGTRISQIYILT